MQNAYLFAGLLTLVASRSDDPDSSFTLDDDEQNFDLNQDQTLQSGYHTIVESLADGNSRLVSEVQDFVQELRRVTLLWEELWLGSLIQIHHDFVKRENQLNDEIKRVNSSSSLSMQEKAALIRGKHIALMKPVSNQWITPYIGNTLVYIHELVVRARQLDSVAQLVRALHRNHRAAGSIPARDL